MVWAPDLWKNEILLFKDSCDALAVQTVLENKALNDIVIIWDSDLVSKNCRT